MDVWSKGWMECIKEKVEQPQDWFEGVCARGIPEACPVKLMRSNI